MNLWLPSLAFAVSRPTNHCSDSVCVLHSHLRLLLIIMAADREEQYILRIQDKAVAARIKKQLNQDSSKTKLDVRFDGGCMTNVDTSAVRAQAWRTADLTRKKRV